MQPSSSPQPGPPTRTWYTFRWYLLSLPLLVFILLPLAALLARTSPANLFQYFTQTEVLQAVRVSLITTLVATGIIIIFGTPVALFLARCKTPLRRWIDTLIDLPTVLPPAVAGLALLLAFGRRGLLGSWLEMWGIQVAFTQAAVVMAQVFIAAPFYVKSAAVGFAAIDPELEQAAALDGANGWQTLRFVILPLSWMALLSGGVMSWARALGEFGATIIFAGNFPGLTQTMPLAIYLGFELHLDTALALSVILIGCSFAALMLVKAVLYRQGRDR